MPAESIGSWSPQYLEQFIRTKIQQDPSILPGSISFKDVHILDSLAHRGRTLVPHNAVWNGAIKTGGQTIGTAASTNVSFPSDTNPGSHNPRFDGTDTFTIIQKGLYAAFGAGSYAANAAGVRRITVVPGGGVYGVTGRSGDTTPTGGALAFMQSFLLDQFDVGDTIHLETFQNSGGNLALQTGANIVIVMLANAVNVH